MNLFKFISIIMVSLSFCSCEHDFPIKINSKTSLNFQSRCGSIHITGGEFSNVIGIDLTFKGTGAFVIKPNDLNLFLETSNKEFRIAKYEILTKEKGKWKPLTQTITVDSSNSISLLVTFNSSLHMIFYLDDISYLNIIPSDFIMCDEKRLIIDTLKVQ